MGDHIQRLDKALGRLVYRTVGSVAVLLAGICAYAAWWHVARGMPNSWGPPLMFALAVIVIAAVVPYCFSRSRTFGEALDAMEGSAGDMKRRKDPSDMRGRRRG